MQAPGRVGFQPHMRAPDILPESPVECSFRAEVPAVSLSDFRFFGDGHQRFEDQAVQAREERHELLLWRCYAHQHFADPRANGFVPDPYHELTPPDLSAGHFGNVIQKPRPQPDAAAALFMRPLQYT